jgi:hypothetical protein
MDEDTILARLLALNGERGGEMRRTGDHPFVTG